VQDRYAALVRGPSVLFPRGFLWLIPAWYTAIALVLQFKGKTPVWYGHAAIGGLALAALTLLCVLATMRHNAFVADNTGVWLGLRGGATRRFGRRRRQLRHLPWSQIEQVQIYRRSYGARLDVTLSTAAPSNRWPRALGKIAMASLLLIIPISYTGRTPGLLSPRSGPPGYRIPLYDVTIADLRLALGRLAPAGIPIVEMPRWRVQAIARRRRARGRPSYVPPAAMAPAPPAGVRHPAAAMTAPPAAAPPAAALPAADAAPQPGAGDQQETRGHLIA
jgi:hypothetical protein